MGFGGYGRKWGEQEVGRSADGDEGGVGGFGQRLVGEAHGGGSYAEGDALAGAVESDEEVVLVKGDGEVLHGYGAEVGQGEGRVDLDPGLIEGDVAEADVGGEAADGANRLA